jgi:deoxyguanosine kinase
MAIVYLSLGSNIGNRQAYLAQAIDIISNKIGEVQKISSLYETSAWGFISDDFLNQVIEVETNIEPLFLISICLDIEIEMGRVRGNSTNYASRIIDIDILFYDDLIIDEQNLVIPHPLIQHRRFILMPLNEIAPGYEHPLFHKSVSTMLEECSDRGIVTVF